MTDNHSFNTLFATKYGIEEAILFDHIYYWCISNKRNGINANRLEGEDFDRYWTYHSYKYFSEVFPYINPSKIRRVVKHLEEEGIILISNFNKAKYDQTSWYTVTEKGEEEYLMCCSRPTTTLFQNEKWNVSNCKMKDVKMTNEDAQNEKPIPTSTQFQHNFNTTSNSASEKFPEPEDKKVSFTRKDYSECTSLIKKVQQSLRDRNIAIDETQYPIPVLNKWLKNCFSLYGVENTKKGIMNSVRDSWLVNTTHYSLSALFSEKIFPKLISNQAEIKTVNTKHSVIDFDNQNYSEGF